MKQKDYPRMIISAAALLILGALISLAVIATFSPDAEPAEAEPQTETQIETQIDSEAEVEESLSNILTDAEFIKAMSEDQQGRLIAIICLATEQGNSSDDVAESIAESFDSISEDYAKRFVDATIITVCSQISE